LELDIKKLTDLIRWVRLWWQKMKYNFLKVI
jgi:hypothetical protein